MGPTRALRSILVVMSACAACGELPDAADQTDGYLTPSTSTTYNITGVQSGKCVEIPNGSTTTGTQATIATCNGSSRQQWRAEAVSSGFRLRNVATNLCADVSGASTADGAALIQWTCGTASNQVFTMPDVATGIVRVVAGNSGKVWDVVGKATA